MSQRWFTLPVVVTLVLAPAWLAACSGVSGSDVGRQTPAGGAPDQPLDQHRAPQAAAGHDTGPFHVEATPAGITAPMQAQDKTIVCKNLGPPVLMTSVITGYWVDENGDGEVGADEIDTADPRADELQVVSQSCVASGGTGPASGTTLASGATCTIKLRLSANRLHHALGVMRGSTLLVGVKVLTAKP